MWGRGLPSTIPPSRCGVVLRRTEVGVWESAVSSFVGVLGIALGLFLVVAVTGRAILGRCEIAFLPLAGPVALLVIPAALRMVTTTY